MENLVTSVHHRKATRKSKTKTKTKPIKVVYISNPMKVKTCASKFRALVQELTGRDAGLPDPTNNYLHTVDGATTAANQTVQAGRRLDAAKTSVVVNDDQVPKVDPSPTSDHMMMIHGQQHQPQSDFYFEPFDHDLDGFSGILSSTLFSVSSHESSSSG
ncbi:hypothetical protein LWI28_019982 [Acer negundo]|uniref:VQ domain-containing protein n=1 Tax=Acer negundo TaxID=4023 RepID=A0AAD5NJC4_ACENE|nr:hypothetical protein LWI28_019982 [Acer negundo]KAK4836899.1 hypothetical protein QYF36_001173 [Acer negundo]